MCSVTDRLGLLFWISVFIVMCLFCVNIYSVLWRCWLGGRKGIRPVKNWVVGCWHGYLSGAKCRFAYDPADATTTHCLLLQIGFTFLVPAHPGSPGQRAVKRVCVCLFYVYNYFTEFHCTECSHWNIIKTSLTLETYSCKLTLSFPDFALWSLEMYFCVCWPHWLL